MRGGGFLSRIPRVTCSRCVFVALLVYVTLDLSLPAMPGAFVFEPEDSVESAQTNRGRPQGELGPLAAPVPKPFRVVPQISDGDAWRAATLPMRQTARDVVSWFPRAALPSAPPSEDPQ
jgi:hypothetical protein